MKEDVKKSLVLDININCNYLYLISKYHTRRVGEIL